MTQLEKSALRRKILQQRQSLSPTQWQLKSNLICDRLKSISFFQEAQTILAYFRFRQEPDLSPLFGLNKTWAFPRCLGKFLVWHSWQPGTELNSGAIATAVTMIVWNIWLHHLVVKYLGVRPSIFSLIPKD
jgi:5-formyltetrahydrofolate cyclo-ligase